MTNSKTYCLFEGRHKIPKNSGAIFSGFDFMNFSPTPNVGMYEDFEQHIKAGTVVRLIVTGLTPALTYLLARVPKDCKLILMHYDSARECYQEQYFCNNGEAWTEHRTYPVYRKKIHDAYMDFKYALSKDVADILKGADYSFGELQGGYTSVKFDFVDVDDLPDGNYVISNSAWTPMNYKYLGLPTI